MLFSPVTPTHIALPPHEHQPLLLEEAAGLRTGLSITRPLKPAFRVGLKFRLIVHSMLGHVNTQSIFFEYHSNELIPDLHHRNSFFIFKRSVRSPSTVYLPFMKAV
jgi:transcriptional regulator